MTLLRSIILVALFGFYVKAQKSYECDFENGLCSFLVNSQFNREQWKIGKGKTLTDGTGPSIDHTQGTDQGSYLYINVKALGRGEAALVTSDTFQTDYCVQFFYHMYGADVGELRVQTVRQEYWGNSGYAMDYFYRQKTQGDRWKEASFTVDGRQASGYRGYKLNFKVNHQNYYNFKGDIALDDIVLTSGKCKDTKSSNAEQLCDFNDYDCGYKANSASQISWQWINRNTRTNSVKPPSDHTLATNYGGYWLAYSQGTSSLATVTLSSPTYSRPKQKFNCLHFYYFMQSGVDYYREYAAKEIYLQARLKAQSADETTLATRAKNVTVDKQWIYVETKVEVESQFQLNFIAGIQSHPRYKAPASIALDDVKMFPGACPEAGFCDFEQDKCTWTDGEGDFSWLRKKANSVVNRISGPKTDKTIGTGNGHYVVISVEENEAGTEANLESEIFPPMKNLMCLTFYYYISGDNVGTLKAVRKQDNITETSLWVMRNEPSNQWSKASAPLQPSILKNLVVIRGIIGNGKKGFMAVDDIQIRKGENCSLYPGRADPRYEAIEKVSCTFDDLNLCKWKQDENTLAWKFGNTTLFDSTGPKEPLNGKGHYLFVSSYDDAQSNKGAIARLQSPLIASFYPDTACFSLYFHMFGAHVGELRIILVPMQDEKTPLGKQIIWRRRGTQPDKWIQFKETLGVTEGDYRIEIEAEGGDGFAGDIAIDEILMSLGACENKQDMCDFESSLCGWTKEESISGKFYWYRKTPKSGKEADSEKGPKTDHTTLTDAGYHLQAVADDGAAAEETTNLVSPNYGRRWGSHCLTFWYYRPGLGTGKINVAYRQGGKDTIQWSAAEDVGKFWHYGQLNVNVNNDFKLVFQAEKGRTDEHQMAIDDILIKNSACTNTESCNFNNDYCSYFQNSTNDFAWLLGTGRVVNTQFIEDPPEDNSVKNGMYLYADMTSPNLKENQTATIVSEILEAKEAIHCVSFSSYIDGADKPRLSMGKMTLDNTQKDMHYKVLQLSAWKENSGKSWAFNQVPVGTLTGESFQVYFTATRGIGPRSFIAIDDISITDGPCVVPTSEPPFIPTEMPKSDVSCDFDDNNFCSWSPDRNARFKFEINNPTKAKDKMPKFDHTKGNYLGRYAYVERKSPSKRTTSLTLKSTPKEWSGDFCFSFWYYMDVEGKNKLSVTAEHYVSFFEGYQFITFWSRSTTSGYRWKHAYVHIKSSLVSPQMRIQAELSTGVIAVDDLEGKGGSCPLSKICTFEDDEKMCGYTQDSSNTMDWDVKKGESDGLMYRMPDHTTQSIEGGYLYIGFNDTSTRNSQRSRVYSPKRDASKGSNCVTFYYHIYNVSKLSFNTYLATDNGFSDPQWTMSISQGLLWHGARFSVAPKTISWQVVFEVTVGSLGYGQVAIDDISVTPGNCPDLGYCDFETEDCLWENVRSPFDDKDLENIGVQKANVMTELLKDDFDWVRHIGEDYFGPPTDKTLGTPQGFYLLLDTRFGTLGQKAIYVSERLRSSAGGSCLRFWYAIPKYNNGATLEILSSGDFITANQEKIIKNNTDGEWKEGLVTILLPLTSDTPFLDYWIFLVGTIGSTPLGYVAIDDISVRGGVCEDMLEAFDCRDGQHVLMSAVCNFHKDCTNGRDEANCADCDFESGQCGWSAPQITAFRWIRSKGGYDRIPADHTKQDSTGYFMLAAATSSLFSAPLTTKMQTVSLRDAFSTCSMEFWYNVLGQAKLSVNLNRNNKSVEIWVPTGYSDDLWNFGEVYLGRIPRDFQIAMEATRVRSDDCHTAVDDIVLKGCETPSKGGAGMCSSDQFNCLNSRCISKDSICDYTDDCGNFADESIEMCESAISRCSFDQSFCDWTNDATAKASFQRRSPFESLEEGPTRDHTSGTASGGFLYLPGRIRTAPARILGPLLQPAEDCQIRFYYDIRGKGSLYLQIKTRTAYGGDENVVWTREDPTSGYFFVEERVTFNETTDYQVIVEASIITAEGKANYIALDDISFSYQCLVKLPPFPTAPPTITTPSPIKRCAYNEFPCKSLGQCIPIAQKCNFVKDCTDGSDEDQCGQCDFHEDMCGLVNTGSGSRWKRAQAQDFALSKNTTVPSADSQGNAEGYFAVLGGTQWNSFLSPGVMRTPPLGETSHACKVEFFYHFNVIGGALELYVNQLGIGKRIRRFSVMTTGGKNWQFVSVPIGNYPKGKVIEFEGRVRNQRMYSGVTRLQDIAVDSINYVNCDPNTIYTEPLNCTFDYNECGWHPDNNFTVSTWTRAKYTLLNYGPRGDHTGGGYFMYVQSSIYLTKGNKAHLVSLKQAPTENRCFTFWYHMYGQDVGTLNIFIRTDNGNSTIWSKTNSQGNAWKQGMRTIRSKDPYQVVIEAIVGSFSRPIIAIDDIFVSEDACPHPVACDFESDFCDWKPENWVLQMGGNIPEVDHTTNTKTGRFAALAESTGRLVSPDYNYTRSDYCLNFWYFIEGDRGTKIQIQKDRDMIEDNAITVWADTAEPNFKGQWLHSRTSITELSDGDYNIVIRGDKTNDSTVVAVDDVAVEEDACPPYGSCTFERDFCTWRNLGKPFSSGLQWIRNSGSTVNLFTGPSVDVTTNSSEGWYVYMDGSNGRTGQTAVLESEILHYAPNACFKFWYHMYGWRSGSLSVVYVNHIDNKIYPVMTISGNQGNSWNPVKRLVKDLPPTYKIRFIGAKGASGDVALDDIFIQQDSCSEPIVTTPTPTELPPTDWDCDFETNSFCLWNNGDSWVVQDGRKALVTKQGPTADNTIGNAFGHYAYYKPLEDTGHEIISPQIFTANDDYCFGFYYYMHSPAPVSLELRLMQYGQITEPQWIKKSSADTQWKYATYFLEKSINMSVILRATRSKLNLGDIAVDDLKFNSGRCPVIKGRSCDFESGDICGFKVRSQDGITWRRVQARKIKFGPVVDKTYGTSEGHYLMAVPSNNARLPGDNKALLIVPNVPSTGIRRSCARFWYQMAGEDVIALNLYVTTPDGQLPPYALWSHATKHGNNTWRVGQRTIDADFEHEIIFEAVMQLGNSGFIALDEVVVRDGSCPPPGSCDFEEDLCTWQNAESGVDIEWIRNSGPTPTNFTGPNVDRTLGTKEGSYVYLQADNPANQRNLVGILQSEYFSLSTERCLSFWAHMNGSEMGSLSVNLSYYGIDQIKTLNKNSWNIEGSKGENWFNRRITIDIDGLEIQDEYQILFIGRTKGRLSDIALDEIDVSNGKCYDVPDEAFDCRDGKHINRTKICDFEKDCESGEDESNCGECDFEHGDCGWQDKTGGYNRQWKRVQGLDDRGKNGPGYDHTFNSSTGYFMFADFTGYGYRESILQSPGEDNQFKQSSFSCIMKFYYFIKPDTAGSISVRKRLATYTTGTVWQWNGGNKGDWKLGTVYLGPTERPFYVEFYHYSQSYLWSYVAIDDITFENCSLPVKKEKCDSNEFRCKNERCVSNNFLCDLQDDCGDNSDEEENMCSNYPKPCTFDVNSVCDWTVKGRAKNSWQVSVSVSNRRDINSGPLVDHTKGIDNNGKYLVVRRFVTDNKNYESYYFSPNFEVSGDSYCSLRFFYYMFGASDSHLKVYTETEQDGWNWKERFTQAGSLGQMWNRAIVNVRSSDPFHFIIGGNPGNVSNQRVAIDDISLSKGCKLFSGELPTPATTALPTVNPCTVEQYHCRSGECIASSKFCDFAKDCADGSDEETCGSCTFEKGFCGWENESPGFYLWDRKNASVDNGYGPSEDHKKSSTGWYAYVTEGGGSVNSPATLVFPKLPETSSHCVMEFWMFRNGYSADFSIKYKRPSASSYSRNGLTIVPELTDNGWQKYEVKIPRSNRRGASLQINSMPDWKVGWKAWKILTLSKHVAIDEINFFYCSPTSLPVDCDFDDDNFNKGFCFWIQNMPTASLKWKRSKGSTALNYTGPTSDHTSGHGYYLYFDPGLSKSYRSATISSPKLPMNVPDGGCFTFWYHMYGQHIGSLDILAGKSLLNTLAWSRKGNQGNKWNMGEVYMNKTYDFQIHVSAYSTGRRLNNIAIDDLKMIDGPCPRTTTCDFETDFCGWNTSYVGSTGWIRTQGSWNWTDERPITDHTLGTPEGYFIYLPNEDSRNVARLESPYYNNYGDICVKFWYNMHGNDVGTLAVYQRTNQEKRDDNLKQLWMKSGDHTAGWKLGRVTLKSLPSFYIAIIAETGKGSGYIALDDILVLHGQCSDPVSCNFEIDTCGWMNSDAAFVDVDWIRRTGLDRNVGGGPSADVSTGTAQGHYMYAYLTGLAANSKSMLLSEDLPVNREYCLSFYFSMFNTVNSSLLVQQLLIGMGWEVAEEYPSSDYASKVWIKKETNIMAENAGDFFQIAFTALALSDQDNDTSRGIAIDDVSLIPQKCGTKVTTTTLPPIITTTHLPTKYDCSFEIDLCMWENVVGTSENWVITEGHSNKTLTRPRTDVTTHSSSGHYITSTLNGTSYWRYSAKLITKDGIEVTPDGTCFKFWYHMYGNNPGTLYLKAQQFHDDEKEEILWYRSKSQGIDWVYEQIHILRPFEYKLLFEGRGSPYGDISLDEFALNFGPCPPRKFCDVEQDYCGFSKDPEGDFQWHRGNGSKTNGPDVDHTLGTRDGNYFYVDTKVSTAVGKKARLESGQYQNKKCLQFWYYLNGIDAGYLEVMTRIGDSVKSVWKEEGDNSVTWHGSQVKLSSPNLEFSYIFQVTAGSAFDKGLIAIDDISVKDDCPDLGSCTFEDGMCLWSNEPNSDLQWLRGSGEMTEIGPVVDVTFGSVFGTYLFVHMINQWTAQPEPAVLVSPYFQRTEYRCFNYFSYRGPNDFDGGLQVYMYRNSDDDRDLMDELLQKDIGKWINKQFEIDEEPGFGKYQIIFEGDLKTRNNFIALDDITTYAGKCRPLEEEIPDFKCDEGKNLLKDDKRCDFYEDCLDGSDEKNCGLQCDFETEEPDPCNWKSSTERLAWNQTFANESVDPSRDHTRNSPGAGHYMKMTYIERFISRGTANFTSPALIHSSSSCRLFFWYYFDIVHPQEILSVFYKSVHQSKLTTLFSLEADNGKSWREAEVVVGRIQSRFQVGFEGALKSRTGVIAIDDIKFESCNLPRKLVKPTVCGDNEFQCVETGVCISNDLLCDFVDDCGDWSDESIMKANCDKYLGRCDFESNNNCGWMATKEKNTEWQILSASGSIPVTRDHTKNSINGKFLYHEASTNYYRHVGYAARLSSQVIETVDTSCKFRFFYTFGTNFNSTKYDEIQDIGSLTVYLRRDEETVWKTLFFTREPPGQYYQKVILPLEAVDYPFQIVIEGRTGTTKKTGGWVVDDVSFTSGCILSNKSLPLIYVEPTTQPVDKCEADEFACVTSKKCIDLEMVCDFVPQCPDASDEAKCGTCTFDEDANPTCGWTDVRGGKWKRMIGPQGVNGLTSNVTAGDYYMYVSKAKAGAVSSRAILRSIDFHDSSSTCRISFYYFMSGLSNNDASLILQLQTKKRQDVVLWKESSDQGNKWQNATVSISTRDAGWHLDFIATHVFSQGDIAIDDIEFLLCAPPFKRKCASDLEFACLSGECIDKNLVCDFSKDCPDASDEQDCTAYYERCDFEKGNICGWHNVSNNITDWILTSGFELNEVSGLDRDHTTGEETGKFLLAKRTPYRYYWERRDAEIKSTAFIADTSDKCKIRFWEHLYESYQSRITVHISHVGDTRLVEQGRSTGSSGDEWKRVEFSLKSKLNFHVVILGTVHEGKKGEVAIDDISFTPECVPVYTVITTPVPTIYPKSWCDRNGEFACEDNSCVPFDSVCDFKTDCPYGRDEKACPAFCDFELGSTCGWSGITKSGDGVEIIVATAKEANRIVPYSPKVDKTTNTSDGSYLMIHAKVKNEAGPIDQFVSPTFRQSASPCKFTFWRTAGGSSIGLLSIKVTLKTENYTVDMISFNNSKEWIREEIGIGRQRGNFTLSINNGKWDNDYVALDDIEFINCALPKPNPLSRHCGEFICKVTKACVHSTRVCDLTDDCGDGTDEEDCQGINFVTEDFESGNEFGIFRSIKDEKSAPLVWEIKNGLYPGHLFSKVGPPFDHTLSSPDGHYVSMATGRNKEYGKRAWLVSGVFQKNPGRGACQVRFYYFMYGSNVNQLNVYTRTTDNLNFITQWKKLWTQSKEVGNFWMRGTVDVKDSSMFEVIFEGLAGIDRKDAIALDDITFTPGCEYQKDKTLPPDGTTIPGSSTTPGPTPCKSDEFYCTEDKVCIPATRRCDFRADCQDESDEKGCVKPYCNFQDKDLCGWMVKHKYNNAPRIKRDVDDTSIFQWIAIQANDEHTKINLKNRPKTDHTANSTEGWYLLADGAPGKYNDITSLVSPSISATNAQCVLDFWVYLSLYSTTLKVYAGKPDKMLQIWGSYTNLRTNADNRNKWLHAKARLSSMSNFQVRFDAHRPLTYSSAVSLDDIKFESCPPPISVDPESKTCSGGEFMCGNGNCIPENLRCDYNNDCLDNSDEIRCSAFVARCDFSVTVCPEWTLESDGEAKWVLQKPARGGFSAIPTTDHTTLTNMGQFITVFSSIRTKDKKAKIRSPTISDYSSSKCSVRFWYNIFNGPSKVLVYKRTSYYSDGMKLIGDFDSDIPDFWQRAEIEIPTDSISKDDYQVVLASNFSFSYSSISIDDISMSDTCKISKGRDLPGKPTTPPPTDDCAPDKFPCKNGKGCFTHLERCNFINDCEDKSDEYDCGTNCTFENGYCGWYNAPYSAYNWTIKQGKSNSIFDILKEDHTLGTSEGNFLIPKGFSREKDTAQILTKPYVISGGSCQMEFWYFLYARSSYSDPGTLNIFLMQSLKGDRHHVLKSLKGKTETMKWYSETVDINTQEHFSIGIEAIYGTTRYSAIAVDDIVFKKCAPFHPPVECAHDEWTCVEQKQCIKKYQYCDGNYDCKDKSDEFQCQPSYGDCNFDSEKWLEECNWKSKEMDFEWSRAQEGRSNETGPRKSQHQRRSAFFLYINSNEQEEGSRAGLMTPVFKASQGVCYLRFWYTMNGSPSLDTLEVFSEGEQGQTFSLWRERGPQGKDWQIARVDVGNSHDYRISFIATVGGDNKTDIAIDEVSFTPECKDGGDRTDPTGPPSVCAWYDFQCKSGKVQCIPHEWKCDCAKDCSDGSDEEDCPVTCLTTGEPKTVPITSTTEWPTETNIPQKHCNTSEKLCAEGTVCIPGILLCDGVRDCPDGSDEKYGCQKAKFCGESFYFCKDKADPPCIHREKICDGKKDCSDGSDESLCDKCPKDFCRNGGTCSVIERKPICDCKKDYLQNRCASKSVDADLEELQRTRKAGVGWIIGVVIGTILLISIMFIIWYKKNTNAERSRLTHAVDNPVYGLNLDTLTFGELNSHMPVRHEDGAGATAIENPLYSFQSEIK